MGIRSRSIADFVTKHRKLKDTGHQLSKWFKFVDTPSSSTEENFAFEDVHIEESRDKRNPRYTTRAKFTFKSPQLVKKVDEDGELAATTTKSIPICMNRHMRFEGGRKMRSSARTVRLKLK